MMNEKTHSHTTRPEASPTTVIEEEPRRHDVLPGVVRMEAVTGQLTTTKRWVIFTSIFVVAYVLGLDITTRNTYVPYATSSFHQHALLSTVNVVRGVIAASLQPTAARLADVFGRIEVFTFAILLHTCGSIVETFAVNVQGFAGGAVLHQLGYMIAFLMIEIMIADFTSMKTRLFFAYIPNWPFLVNTWIGGNVTSAVLSTTTWKWGIGMFAILTPASALPLVITMFMLGRKAQKQPGREGPVASSIPFRSFDTFFWDLDIIGVLLLTAGMAMTLIPLTLAGGESSGWRDAGIIVPIILGFLLLLGFVFWETKTATPMLPFHLLTDRTVWAGLAISCLFPFAFLVHGNYLFSLLMVSYNFSIEGATRVASLYTFSSVVIGAILGVVVIKVRRLKHFILGGIMLWFVGAGLIYHYRGGEGSKSGLIAGEVLIGMGAGFVSWPIWVLIQTAAKHEHISVLISLVFTVNSIGQALGNCVSGAIWSQTLFRELSINLEPFGNATLASAVYAAPLLVIPEYPIGTPERSAIITSFRFIQRNLTIAAISIAGLIFIFALFLRNPRLSDEQTQPEAEGRAQDGQQTKDQHGAV